MHVATAAEKFTSGHGCGSELDLADRGISGGIHTRKFEVHEYAPRSAGLARSIASALNGIVDPFADVAEW